MNIQSDKGLVKTTPNLNPTCITWKVRIHVYFIGLLLFSWTSSKLGRRASDLAMRTFFGVYVASSKHLRDLENSR